MYKLRNEDVEQRILSLRTSGGIRHPKPPQRRSESAVMVPLVFRDGQYQILFEKRALSLKQQPGDICLPGGGIDPGETPRQAAVREVSEELLVDPDQVEILSPLDGVLGPGERTIWPFVGLLREYRDTWSADEVDHTFLVPLAFFLQTEPDRYEAQQIVQPAEDFPFEKVSGGESYRFRRRKYDFLFYSYGEYHIWGATARIINRFVSFWKQEEGMI